MKMKGVCKAKIRIFFERCFVIYFMLLSVDAGVVSAAGVIPEMNLIKTYSSTGGNPQFKDNDQDLIYKIDQGDDITFTITTTQPNLNYLWQVMKGNQVIESSTETTIFNWTVPSEKSTWEIYVEATLKNEIGDIIGKDYLNWSITTSDLITVNPSGSIQDAIDSVCPEGGVVELTVGTWTIDSTILINKSNVVFRGAGKTETVIDGGSGDSFNIILVRGPDAYDPDPWAGPFPAPPPDPVYIVNIIIENLTVRGSGPAAGKSQRGIHIHMGWKVDIGNVCVEETPHKGISVGYSNDIDIEKCDCYRTEGIFTFRSTIGTIANCTSTHSDYCCIELNAQTWNYVVDNNVVHHSWGSGISVYGGSGNNVVSNNLAHSTYGYSGISLYAARNTTVVNNTCHSNRYGIRLIPEYYFNDNIIRNNLVYSNNDAGIISYFDEPKNAEIVTIESNTISSNGGNGIQNDLVLMTLNTKNNIISNNGGYGIRENAGTITTSYNNVWSNTAGDYSGVSNGPGDISIDPLFGDAESGDFHLKSQYGRWNSTTWVNDDGVISPCIDAGDPSDDYSNEPDYPNGQINMGAYGNTIYASKSVEDTNDTISPTVSIVVSRDGAKVFGRVLIEINASDNYGVIKVELYINDVLNYTFYTSPYEWIWDTKEIPEGEYRIKAVAYDTNSNSSEEEITVKVIKVGGIVTYPNPYVKGKSLIEKISFGNLPKETTIRIYTVSGDLVKTIKHKDTADGGSKEWDISGIASGVYMYCIESSEGMKKGKVSIIK